MRVPLRLLPARVCLLSAEEVLAVTLTLALALALALALTLTITLTHRVGRVRQHLQHWGAATADTTALAWVRVRGYEIGLGLGVTARVRARARVRASEPDTARE